MGTTRRWRLSKTRVPRSVSTARTACNSPCGSRAVTSLSRARRQPGGTERCLLGQGIVLAIATRGAELPQILTWRFRARRERAIDPRLHALQQVEQHRRGPHWLRAVGRGAAPPVAHAPVQPAGWPGDRVAGSQAVEPPPVRLSAGARAGRACDRQRGGQHQQSSRHLDHPGPRLGSTPLAERAQAARLRQGAHSAGPVAASYPESVAMGLVNGKLGIARYRERG